MAPFKASANPFAHWGISISARRPGLLFVGFGPVKEMYVSFVAAQSPADLAGVQLGDEITAVNGIARPDLPWSELKKQFYNTEKGAVVSLALFDWATSQSRRVELVVRSNQSWLRTDGVYDLKCWGLVVSTPKQAEAELLFNPKQQRILEMRPAPVMERRRIKGAPNRMEPALTKEGEVKMELKPVYVTRRIAQIKWSTRKLVLVERENRVVEIIEADEVPKNDAVIGRLVPEGATLLLNPDGTYEIRDASPKSETSSSIGEPTPSSSGVDVPRSEPSAKAPKP